MKNVKLTLTQVLLLSAIALLLGVIVVLANNRSHEEKVAPPLIAHGTHKVPHVAAPTDVRPGEEPAAPAPIVQAAKTPDAAEEAKNQVTNQIAEKHKEIQLAAINRLHEDFVRQKNLPEAKAQALAAQVQGFFSDLAALTKPGEVPPLSAIAAARNQRDANIQAILGNDGFKDFQAYQTTLPLRTAVNQWADGLSSAGYPVPADQQQNVTEILLEERQKLLGTPPPLPDLSQAPPVDPNAVAKIPPGAIVQAQLDMQKKAQLQSQADANALARLNGVVDPQALQFLDTTLKNASAQGGRTRPHRGGQ